MNIKIDKTERRKLDTMFKNVLSIKEFLAIIMKETLDEYKEENLETIINEYIENHIHVGDTLVHSNISGTNTEINLDNKKTTYDINFYARLPKSNDKIGIVINIEVQSDFYPGYQILNRAHYYNARNMSVQFGEFFDEYEYDNLRKVVSIWLMLDPPQYMSDGINRYTMHEEHIYGNIKENKTLIRKNEIIMVYLSHKSKSKFIQLFNELRDGIFKFDEFYETLKNDFGYEKRITREKEVTQMCDYGQYVINKGLKLGMKQGIEQGIEQGIFLATLKNIKNIMKNLNIDEIVAMQSLEIEEKDYPIYLEALKNNQ